MLSYTDGAYAFRSACKQQVTNFQRYKAADIRNNIIHMKQHLRRTAFLDFLPINRQIKMQLLNISKTFYRNKSTDCRRTIESFTELPWSASFSETAL